MRYLGFLLLVLTLHASAHADSFYKLVGYRCDAKAGELIVTYRGAYNEAGQAMMAAAGPTEWDPGSLILSMVDDDHIDKLKTITASCRIGRTSYELRLGPSPQNMNIQGSCGAVIGAWVEVRRDRKVVLPRYELEGDCHADGPVTTRITLRPGAAPVFTKVSTEQWFQQ